MELVLFDLDGTLLDHDRAERVAATDWIESEGWPSTVGGVATARRWHAITEDAFREYRSGVLTFQGQRRARVSRLLTAMGSRPSRLADADLDRLFERYHSRYAAAWSAFPDVVDSVSAIRTTHRVAILSNGERAEKVAKVRSIGLDGLVEMTLASADLGFAKPDSRAFSLALDRLGVSPGDAVYVGDHLDVDARAADAAGLCGVWLNRDGRDVADPGVPTIDSLSRLPAWLAQQRLHRNRRMTVPSGRGRRLDSNTACAVQAAQRPDDPEPPRDGGPEWRRAEADVPG